ncbi:MAG: type VI secretion system amidase effector protein Tae4 [Azoarcus sp.]|jgi:hypothetical protein|nr:type VI secretion system amidase effector protein Tae4 [Azoarcus sp.]
MHRPFFDSAWARFLEVNVSVQDVGRIIGGKVKLNIDQRTFPNACPIRMSYVLNHTGFPVNKNLVPLDGDGRLQVSSGADSLWYIFRVKALRSYLQTVFGDPDIELQTPPIVASALPGEKGIVIITGSGWDDAAGHATLFDGSSCSDICHFAGDPENGTFTPTKAVLWRLP